MKTQTLVKKKLLREFRIMRGLEESARDFYLQICSDPDIKDASIKKTLKNIAEDETRHIQLAQEILDIINENL
jgi:rubrerythrin